MDFGAILNTAASLIQNDNNEATSGLDLGDIANALKGALGEEGIIENVKNALSSGNLAEVVGSWVGDGENASISSDFLVEFMGEDKIEEFAQKLGIDKESAISSLSESLPNIIDTMTNEESSTRDNILESIGGIDGAMNIIGKFFK